MTIIIFLLLVSISCHLKFLFWFPFIFSLSVEGPLYFLLPFLCVLAGRSLLSPLPLHLSVHCIPNQYYYHNHHSTTTTTTKMLFFCSLLPGFRRSIGDQNEKRNQTEKLPEEERVPTTSLPSPVIHQPLVSTPLHSSYYYLP